MGAATGLGGMAGELAGNVDGNFQTYMTAYINSLGAGGDAFTKNAIQDFTNVVSTPGVSTGAIIAAAAELKMKLGASKAYYDVISALGDDLKRIISSAVGN